MGEVVLEIEGIFFLFKYQKQIIKEIIYTYF